MRNRSPLLIPCLLAMSLLFFGCAKNMHGPADDPHPFDATGLTAHKGETAEEILLRAHFLDPDAMLLASVGYALGIGGFPKSRDLADGWASVLNDFPDYLSIADLARAVKVSATHDDMFYDQLFARCESGGFARQAALLRDAGIFDLNDWCAKAIAAMSEEEKAFAEKTSRSRLDEISARRQRTEDLRALAAGPVTEANAEKLYGLIVGYVLAGNFAQVALYNPDKGRLEWSAARILDFMYKWGTENRTDGGRDVHFVALRHLHQRLFFDSARMLDLFRRAHDEDPDAMLELTKMYATGEYPFFAVLRYHWQYIAARHGEARGMLGMGAFLLSNPKDLELFYCLLAMEYGDDETRALASEMAERIEAHMDPADVESVYKTSPPFNREKMRGWKDF